jgi:hypothetical protein
VTKSFLLLLLLLCVLFATENFWVPRIVSTAFERCIKFPLTIGRASVSLLRGRFDFKNCAIENPGKPFETKAFANANQLFADINMSDLFKETIGINKVVIDIDDVYVVSAAGGTNNCIMFGKNCAALMANSGAKSAMKPVAKATSDGNTAAKGKKFQIQKLTVALGSVHIVDESTGVVSEYKIGYRREFANVKNFGKISVEIYKDLQKYSLPFVIDAAISSVFNIPASALSGIIKVKDMSLGIAHKAGDAAKHIGKDIVSGVKKAFRGKKK